jgi:transcriptional regulator with XRE-family HTH domain
MRDRTEPRPSHAKTRRRAAGLRREEVAVDAGISVTWYTWLEQGRPVRVSGRTLNDIARALRLDTTERAHLMRLARAARASSEQSITEVATESVRTLADGLHPHPVYVVNGLWDVLHANAAARAMFGDFAATPGVTDNILRRLYLDPDWRERFVDWDAVSGSAVAQFRAATGHMVGAKRWRDFVDRLTGESPAFAARWRRHELASAFPRHKTVRHPESGERSFLYASVAPDAEPTDLRLIVYTALPDVTNGAGSKRRAVRRAAR